MTLNEPCPLCQGRVPIPGSAACEKCRGKRTVERNVRISDALTPDIISFAESYRMLRLHGLLPDAGGVNDQAETWVEAVNALDGLIQKVEQREAAHGNSAKR